MLNYIEDCTFCKYFKTKLKNTSRGNIGHCAFGDDIGYPLYIARRCGCYQLSVSFLINTTIRDAVLNTRGSNCWTSRKYIIQEELNRLNPDLSKEHTSGMIAFDVPDKDRMKIRTQRFLTRKLILNNGFLPDHVISTVGDEINSVLFPDIETTIIKGQPITEAYRKSVGGSSCMTDCCAEHTKLYEMNPDKIQMLIMRYLNDSARAILYKLDNDKGYFLDRVYASNNLLEDKMYFYAEEKKWISYNNINGKSTEEKDTLIISDLVYEDGHVPYMDTFNGDIDGGKLTLSRGGSICMDSTDGCIEGGGYVCEWCAEHVHEDDAVSIGNYAYCQYCIDEHFTFCERCHEYVNSDDAVLIKDINKYVCNHCVSGNYVLCEDCESYIEDDYVTVESERCICMDCSTSTEYKECVECNEWFYEANINEDGYCNECEPEAEDEEEHSTHTDDPRPFVSCKTDDTNKLPYKEENE